MSSYESGCYLFSQGLALVKNVGLGFFMKDKYTFSVTYCFILIESQDGRILTPVIHVEKGKVLFFYNVLSFFWDTCLTVVSLSKYYVNAEEGSQDHGCFVVTHLFTTTLVKDCYADVQCKNTL